MHWLRLLPGGRWKEFSTADLVILAGASRQQITELGIDPDTVRLAIVYAHSDEGDHMTVWDAYIERLLTVPTLYVRDRHGNVQAC